MATPHGTQRKSRRLNVPCLLGSALIVAIAAPAAYAWHAHQVRSMAALFLERASQLEATGEWMTAATYLSRYLAVTPVSDLSPEQRKARVAAQVRLARCYDKGAATIGKKNIAIDLYRGAIGAATGDVATADELRGLRERYAELFVETGRYIEAIDSLERLRAEASLSPRSQRNLALALDAQFRAGALIEDSQRLQSVGETLTEANRANPADAEIALRLSTALRESPQLFAQAGDAPSRNAAADEVIEGLVKAAPHDAQSLLARYRYRKANKLPHAKDDLDAARALAPDDLEVVIAAGGEALEAAQSNAEAKAASLEEAVKLFEKALSIKPDDERAALGLGSAQRARGNLDAAIAAWRKGIETNPRSLTLRWNLIDALIAGKRPTEAAAALDEADNALAEVSRLIARKDALNAAVIRDLLRGKYLLLTGDVGQALPTLRRVAETGGRATEAEIAQVVEALTLIAAIDHTTGLADEAHAAIAEAAELKSDSVALRYAALQAATTAGDFQAAVDHSNRLMKLVDSPEACFLAAQARYRQQMARPAASRKWDQLTPLLDRLERWSLATNGGEKDRPQGAPTAFANPWRLPLLKAQYLFVSAPKDDAAQADRRRAEATAILQSLDAHYHADRAYWAAAVPAYILLKDFDGARRAVSRLRELQASPADLALLQSTLENAAGNGQAACDVLRKAIAEATAQPRSGLRAALIAQYRRQGQLAQARDELAALQAEEPRNLRVVAQLLDLAHEMGDMRAAERWEKLAAEIEGPSGTLAAYYRARRLLLSPETRKDSLAEAARVQADLIAKRPKWANAYLLRALVLQQQGQLDGAADALKEAIRLGARQTAVYEQLVALLYRLNRLSEAEHYLDELPDNAAPSLGISAVEVALAADRGDRPAAIAAARRTITQQPRDPMPHIWLAQLLMADDRAPEAESALREAIQLAPKDPRTHNALFAFYLRQKDIAKARAALKTLGEQVHLPAADLAVVLGQGFEMIGDTTAAQQQYREALRVEPRKVAAMIRLAASLADRSPQDAETLLRKALEIEPDNRLARRGLAVLLASAQDGAQRQAALNLLATDGGHADAADRRLQAMMLAEHRDEGDLAKARGILEDLVADARAAQDGDRVALARIYEREGKWQAARDQYVTLVTRAKPTPAHLAYLVDLLLRHNLADEATHWLEKLEALGPDSLPALALRARWLQAKGQTEAIAPLVEAKASAVLAKSAAQSKTVDAAKSEIGGHEASPGATAEWAGEGAPPAQVMWAVGQIYLSVDDAARAAVWFRRLRDEDPRAIGPLLSSLCKEQRFDEAIAACRATAADSSPNAAASSDRQAESVRATDSHGGASMPLAVAALADALALAKPSAETWAKAEPLFQAAGDEYRDDATLLTALGNARVVQGRQADAIALYGKAVALAPRNVLLLNNLATLLAEDKGSLQKSLMYIDRAIQLAGRQPALLDTKATILDNLGDAAKAVACLEEATQGPTSDARLRFHLAVAYDKTGDRARAQEQLHRALEENLAAQILTAADERLLAEMQRKYPRGGGADRASPAARDGDSAMTAPSHEVSRN